MNQKPVGQTIIPLALAASLAACGPTLTSAFNDCIAIQSTALERAKQNEKAMLNKAAAAKIDLDRGYKTVTQRTAYACLERKWDYQLSAYVNKPSTCYNTIEQPVSVSYEVLVKQYEEASRESFKFSEITKLAQAEYNRAAPGCSAYAAQIVNQQ